MPSAPFLQKPLKSRHSTSLGPSHFHSFGPTHSDSKGFAHSKPSGMSRADLFFVSGPGLDLGFPHGHMGWRSSGGATSSLHRPHSCGRCTHFLSRACNNKPFHPFAWQNPTWKPQCCRTTLWPRNTKERLMSGAVIAGALNMNYTCCCSTEFGINQFVYRPCTSFGRGAL